MLVRVVWRPVGNSTAVDLHISLAKLKVFQQLQFSQ
jgi:hypothetical protein